MTGSTDSSEKKLKEAAIDFESTPLNESFTYEEAAESQHKVTPEVTVDVIAELEDLLKSGLSELLGESGEEEKEDEFEELELDE